MAKLRRYFGAAERLVLLQVQREIYRIRSLEKPRGYATPGKKDRRDTVVLVLVCFVFVLHTGRP